MSIVGTAEVLVKPVTTGFDQRLRNELAPNYATAEKDAAKAGEKVGSELGEGMGRGVKKEGSKLATIIEGATGIPLSMFKHKVSDMEASMGKAGGATTGFAQKLDSLGGKSMAGLAVAAAVVGVAGLKMAGNMESATAKIAAATGQTTDSAKKIGAAFDTTAGHLQHSGIEMAEAFSEVAGQFQSIEGHALNSKESLVVMTAASHLATAQNISLGEATGSLARIMQAFHEPVSQAAHTTDILHEVADSTGLGVEQLSTQLERMKAKLGANSGSVEELATAMVDLAKNGIKGRAAVSVLANETNSLVHPSKKGAEAIKDMGLQTLDASGHFRGIGAVMHDLIPKLEGMTEGQKKLAIETIFGKSQASAMEAVIKGGIPTWEASRKQVEEKGTAEDAAAKQSKTLKGELKLVKATLTDVATVIGSHLVPVIATMVHAFLAATGFVLSHKLALIALGAVITGILGPAMLIFTVNRVGRMASAIADNAATVRKWGAALIEGAAKVVGFGTATAAAGTEVEVAGGQMALGFEEAGAGAVTMEAEASPAIGAILLSLAPFILAIAAVGLAAYVLVTKWRQIWGEIKDIVSGAVDFIKDHWKVLLAILSAPFTGPLVAILLFKKQILGAFHAIVGGIGHALGGLAHIVATPFEKGFGKVVHFFSGMPSRFLKIAEAIGEAIWKGVKWGINELASGLEHVLHSIGLPGFHIGPVHFGGIHPFSGVHIPRLAAGGIVDKPTLALIGESGREAVVPLDRGKRRTGVGGANGGFQMRDLNIHGSNMDPTDVVHELAWGARTGKLRFAA